MAENESLDLGNSPRMRVVYDAFLSGKSCQEVASILEHAVIGGLRNALKQMRDKGVPLNEFLKNRHDNEVLRQLIRKIPDHDYARLFTEAARICGPTEMDCVADFIEAVFDKVTDQICHRVAGSEKWPTIDDVQSFTVEVREKLTPFVERIVSKLVEDPNSIPRSASTKGRITADATAELMNQSLLGVPSQ